MRSNFLRLQIRNSGGGFDSILNVVLYVDNIYFIVNILVRLYKFSLNPLIFKCEEISHFIYMNQLIHLMPKNFNQHNIFVCPNLN
jgi:hypothetical protein